MLLLEVIQLRGSLSRIYIIFRRLLLGGVIAFLAWRIFSSWSQITTIELRWSGLNVVGALISGLLAYQCLEMGWLVLLKRVNHFEARYLALYTRIWWVSYLYRYVPGKVFLLVERARMGSAIGIPPAIGAALAIVETFLAILAGTWVSLLTVSYYTSNGHLFIPVALVSVGILLLLPFGFRLICAIPIISHKFPELKCVTLDFQDLFISLWPYIFHYLLVGLSLFLITQLMISLPWSVLPGLCGVYALSHVTGLVTIVSPGGLGIRESTLSVQLGRLMPVGVTEVVAVGARIWFTFIELILYLAMSSFCPKLPNPNHDDQMN